MHPNSHVAAVVPTAIPSRPRLALALCLAAFAAAAAFAATLTNDRYQFDIATDGAVTIRTADAPPQLLQPEFAVLFSARDPGYHVNHQNYHVAPRTAARWRHFEEDLTVLNRRLSSPVERELRRNDVVVTADAKGGRTWTYRDAAGKTLLRVSGDYARGTTNPLLAGELQALRAHGAKIDGRVVRWEFPAQSGFQFSAELTLPEGSGDPRISHRLEAVTPGWYSVAFTGAPTLARNQAATFPQECAGRGFRQFNHLVHEGFLRLPRAQLSTGQWNVALVVDAAESPFRIPARANARFGLMLQLADEKLRPMSFAPVMGGAESRLKAGDVRTFTLHLVVRPGDWKAAYTYIARTHYGFRDMRDNSGAGSINRTLEATMDFLADRKGGNRALWHAEQKYYDYWTDNSGIFKPFSPLFGLSAAIITDDEDFYWARALPQVEFALSRANNTFAPYEVENNGQVQSRNRQLGRPYLNAAQLVQLAGFYQNRTPLIAASAQEVGFSDRHFTDLLARHELTGHPADLAAARRTADTELQRRRPTGEGDDYMNWLELYHATLEPRYLAAAIEGAYGLTTTINLSPLTPDSTLVADRGGRVAVHEHSIGRHRRWGFMPPVPLATTEQRVPAWRLSLTGLQSPAYRGEYWMNHHGQLMRLAALAHDEFLRDVARWGMVGRFGNHAGDNRSNLSLIPERDDAIERPVWEWHFATVNPGHAWEFAGMVLDFLVSDAFERSRGAIDFPGRPMPGASFRVRTYGDRPGRFYDDQNVRLWLPRRLITSDHRQFDYVAGYGNGKLYLAFLNQSFADEEADIALDLARVDLSGVKAIQRWEQNRPTAPLALQDGRLRFRVPAKGIVALALDGARVNTTLQAKLFDPAARPLGPKSFARTKASFGTVYAQLLSPGRGLTSAFIYTDALPDNTISATLRYRQGSGEWRELHDAIFPYEFSPPYAEGGGPLECVFLLETADQKIETAPAVTLHP